MNKRPKVVILLALLLIVAKAIAFPRRVGHVASSFSQPTASLDNNAAVEAGLKVLEAGGDFADGVIAYEGNWLGADTFVSFDKKAVKILSSQGVSAKLLA